MRMTYVPPRKNKASNIKIDDVGNNFQSDDVEGALQELAENGGSGSNIDDTSIETNKTWSANKLSSQFNTIAKKTYIEDGKLYLLQEDGTKIDTGTTLPTGGSGGGIDGREIELQKSTTHIQWRYVGDLNWTNLVLLSDITGGSGKGINSISKTNTVDLVDTYTITFTDNSTTTFKITNGSNGVKGDPGATPNIQIGTVDTLNSGSNATASISGTTTNPLLNLGIPKGADGDQSDKSWILLGNITLTSEVVSAQWDVPNANEIFIIMKNTDSSSFSAGWVKHCINNGSERGIKAGVVIDSGKSAIVIIRNFKKYIVSNMCINLLDSFLGTAMSMDTSFTKINTEQITNYKIIPTNPPVSLEMEVYYR